MIYNRLSLNIKKVKFMIKKCDIIAVPPGETIKEQLYDRCMSQKEFAVRMNMSEKHINLLIQGDIHLTSTIAVCLEKVLGIPAQFWVSLEANYREKLAKAEAENSMDNDVKQI